MRPAARMLDVFQFAGKASGWMSSTWVDGGHTEIHQSTPGGGLGGESSNWILRMRVRLQTVADICRFGGGSGELRR